MKRKIRGNAGVGLSFVLVLTILLIVQLIFPTSTYSLLEKRTLDSAPSLSLEGYSKGKFQEDFESYTNDQFPTRTALSEIRANIDFLLGSRKKQGVYILPDMLAQEFTGCTKDEITKRADSVNTFVNKYPDINASFILVPNKIGIYKEKFSLLANVLDQKKCIDQFSFQLDKTISMLDTYSILNSHKQEQIYYKTDHHWTTEAANYTFDSWLSMQNIENKKIDYDSYLLTDNFVGSLANQISYTKFQDRMDILIPKETQVEYIVDYGNNKQVASVYDIEASKEDPYMVFFGGNHPIFTIDTNVNNDKSIIIFKDSYANNFIPLLIPYYSKITVVDSRYYFDNINDVMSSGFTDMLFLYNVNTYLEDTSLQELLKE